MLTVPLWCVRVKQLPVPVPSVSLQVEKQLFSVVELLPLDHPEKGLYIEEPSLPISPRVAQLLKVMSA